MKKRSLVVALIAIALSALLGYQYLKVSTLSFDCRNEPLQEIASPEGKYTATFFERNCGATTPYHRIVTLRLTGTRFDPEKHDNWVFVSKGQTCVQLRWIDGHHLDIVSSVNDDNTHKTWGDVEISFSQRSSMP